MKAITALKKVDCGSTPECPGDFYVPAYIGNVNCPNCGTFLHWEGNGKNAGPRLYDPETGNALDEQDDVIEGARASESDADEVSDE